MNKNDPNYRSELAGQKFQVGNQVRPFQLTRDDQYVKSALRPRRDNLNKIGRIFHYHNSHGLCYDVIFGDVSKATYDPEELEMIVD